MPPLVDYFILLALMNRAFALNGAGSTLRARCAWRVARKTVRTNEGAGI